MKKRFLLGISLIVLVLMVFSTSLVPKSPTENNLTLKNVALFALASAEGTGNKGPAQTVDCAGWGTGTKKVCLCTNEYDCTESGCS